jgi:hypothetical protein
MRAGGGEAHPVPGAREIPLMWIVLLETSGAARSFPSAAVHIIGHMTAMCHRTKPLAVGRCGGGTSMPRH